MINFDFHKYVNKHVKKEDKLPYLEKAKELRNRFVEGDLAYWNKLDTYISKEELRKLIETTKYIKANCDVFVVIGIGGSYMGAKAVIEALSPTFNRRAPEIIFLGNNLCAEEYLEVLDYIREREVIVNVISKSGTTLEPSVAYHQIMKVMREKYNEDELKTRIIMTTDREKGELRREANEVGYTTFTVPDNVGGRFSVLTPVGLLPIAVAGINVVKLLNGATESFNRVDRALEYAIIRDILYNKGKKIESFTVYNSKLAYFAEWLKQLFGETQGKDGKGLYPTSCVNTRDLHSLGQFLQDGTDLIFETVIGIEKDVTVRLDEYDIELNSLNRIALDMVATAHNNGHTPSGLITIDEKNEETMGELIQFFILASIAGALLLEVNPFDQPGVEDYKKLIQQELK